MFTYQIDLEYQGTNFVGWQFQKNGVSVQEVLEKALSKFLKDKIKVIGSGRTDAGVHAKGQSAHFKTNKKIDYKNKYPILLAPGPQEIEEASKLNGKVVLDDNKPVNIKTLVSLINKAKFVIANDTGPAHIASHLDKKGLVLFGSHTTAKKVSIENFNFKALTVQNLEDLSVETVLSEVKSRLN